MSSHVATAGSLGPALPPCRETRSPPCWVLLRNPARQHRDSLHGGYICQPLLNLTVVTCQTARQHLDYSLSVGLAELWHPPGPDPKLLGFNGKKKVHWSHWLWICPFAHLLWWFIQHWHTYLTSEAHRVHDFNLTISLVTGKEVCWQLRHWKTLIILCIIITFYFPTEGRNYNEKS